MAPPALSGGIRVHPPRWVPPPPAMSETRPSHAAPPPTEPPSWHDLTAELALEKLKSRGEGLTSDEASRRLALHGPNEVEEGEEAPWWTLLLHQFRDPLIYILLGAAVVTTLLRDHADTVVILVVVVLNAAIGFVQEFRARKAIAGLARMHAPTAHVFRDGIATTVPGRELVPGDVVLLASGDRVPADLRLLSARELQADESALTGESVPVTKTVEPLDIPSPVPGDRTNEAFLGTVITRGRGRGVVSATGASTEVGRIAQAVHGAVDDRSPLQARMERLGTQVGLAVLGLCLLVLVVGLARGMAWVEIVLTAVALAVSAIPEGLPVVVTITLAVGVRRMAGRNALLRSLAAVETLGSTTVIGSDKTGTLTRNEMMVRAASAGGLTYTFAGEGYGLAGEVRTREGVPGASGVEELLRAAALASEADPAAVARGEATGDPTELALLVAAARAGLDLESLRGGYPEVDVLPFESERRFMASLNRLPEGGVALHLKGGPEAVLARCTGERGPGGGIVSLDAERVLAAARAMGDEGLRVLAVASAQVEGERIVEGSLEGLTLLGLVGMEDPVRPEAVEAVRAARQAGIRVLMLTGDHVGTARAIGRQLGLRDGPENALEGQALDRLDAAALAMRLGEVDIYARVAPEHKLRITRALREAGEVVAVTGDGVNDAPALAAAHLGVAMGRSGTDVAREASDMVLADDNFATITAAVEEGRIVFSNLRKVTFFLLSTGVGEVMAILLAVLLGWPLPFVAAQILWVNLVTNGLQDVALAFEPAEPGLLERRPRPEREGVVTLRLAERLLGVGVVLAGGTLWTFWWVMNATADLELARSAAMTQMVVFQFFHVFNCRSLDRSVFRIAPFSNRILFGSLVLAGTAHWAALHWGPLQALLRTTPLPGWTWGGIVAVGTLVVLGGELDKWVNRRRNRPIG